MRDNQPADRLLTSTPMTPPSCPPGMSTDFLIFGLKYAHISSPRFLEINLVSKPEQARWLGKVPVSGFAPSLAPLSHPAAARCGEGRAAIAANCRPTQFWVKMIQSWLVSCPKPPISLLQCIAAAALSATKLA